jgi:hypothetical protein
MEDTALVSGIRLVDAGTWSVSDDPPSLAILTAAWDVAAYEGRAYPGTAPGAIVLAAAVYAALKPVFAHFDLSVVKSTRAHGYYVHNSIRLGRAPPRHVVDSYLLQIALTWLVIAPLMAAFGVRVVEFLWSGGEPASKALAVGLTATLASFLLYYTSVYSRQALASLMVWHAALTVARGEQGRMRSLGAAAMLGFAVTVEYSSFAVVALLLGVWLPRLPSAVRWAVLGVIALAVLALGLYHASLFGSPWSTPYQHRYWPEGKWLRGIDPRTIDRVNYGIGMPRLSVLFELLLGSYKGVFVHCPALGLAAIGHILAIAAPARRRPYLFCVITILTYLVLNSALGSHLPPDDAKIVWGGLNILWGPRHLLLTIPFFAFGLTGLDWTAPRVRWAACIALAISFCINLAGCLTRQRFMATPNDDPRLDRPVTLAASWVASDGLRVPLLDAHGVSPGSQAALLTLLTAGSVGIVVLSVRWLGNGGVPRSRVVA